MSVSTTDEALKVLKTAWPKLRRNGSTAIIRSGSRRTVFGCLCGDQHTCATDWDGRSSKHVTEWRAEHADCAINLANRYLAGEAVTLSFGRFA
jgi:hypothetical protein